MTTWMSLLKTQRSDTDYSLVELPKEIPACLICRGTEYEIGVEFISYLVFPVGVTQEQLEKASLDTGAIDLKSMHLWCKGCNTSFAEVFMKPDEDEEGYFIRIEEHIESWIERQALNDVA